MKKIAIIIMVFLFAATATSDAGIYNRTDNGKTSTGNGKTSGQSGALYKTPAVDSKENFDSNALFKIPGDPGTRPDSEDGIGVEAPLSDGLPVLIACCLGLIIMKVIRDSRFKIQQVNKFTL